MAAFDDIRVSNIDPFGPVVLSHTPLVDEGDVSRFDVTFDEPIDATTFGPEDVSMTLPGAIVPINSVTTTDNLTFTITLSSARLGGLYDLSIGPNIVGMNGIPMNQDGDSINGELNGEDAYVGTLFVPVTPVPVPYFQGFEAGDLSSLAGWTFRAEGEYSWGGGDWRLVSDRNPFAGNYHLRATQHADCWTQHDAVLTLDTSAFDVDSELVLEFYMQRISGNNKSGGGRNMGKLLVSDDGVNWTQVGAANTLIDTSEDLLTDLDGDGTLDLVPPLDNYTHYQFDFDAMLAKRASQRARHCTWTFTASASIRTTLRLGTISASTQKKMPLPKQRSSGDISSMATRRSLVPPQSRPTRPRCCPASRRQLPTLPVTAAG